MFSHDFIYLNGFDVSFRKIACFCLSAKFCRVFIFLKKNQMDFKLSEKDLEQIREKGRDPERVTRQLARFNAGFPHARLRAAAIPGNGIHVLDEAGLKYFSDLFSRLQNQKIIKFVPASGAASRMFSHLLAFRSRINDENSVVSLPEEAGNPVTQFFTNIEMFAFSQELSSVLKTSGHDLINRIRENDFAPVLAALLDNTGLGYASLPKALITFHRYNTHCRTSAEEHLAEAAAYCTGKDNTAYLHFTLSPEHVTPFYSLMDKALPFFSEKTGASFRIDHSLQKPSTDTPAVTPQLDPFRDDRGQLVFRPGGHGALIENLNDLAADIIFIKNIDNVVPEYLLKDTVLYKSALAGLLAEIRDTVHHGLKLIEERKASHGCCDKLQKIAEKYFCLKPLTEADLEKRCEQLFALLNRPIRVCGMVKNLGEPGGGPFFVEDSRGSIRLQIVESSQIDLSDQEQQEIFKSATHFNPVDLVCSTRDFRGRSFDLNEFIDADTGFISEKSFNGRPLKAMELPGLWNGAMADWNTVFVEVPVSTFNPVKTINDLLRSEHSGLKLF
jgi:hypothetical protein